MNKSPYNLSLLGAASTFAMALVLAGGAHAQDQDNGVEEVVVTGTRLPAGLTSATPVATVSSANIEQKAPAQIIEALYDVPAFKQDSGAGQSQRSANATATVNLRGLGNVRTLTLVNGMRQVGTNTQVFDTNWIPSSLVERVEVVTGGASAAYGSDAVAGVVNFIINDRLEGIRASAQVGVAEAGDNEGYTLGFAYGRGFANDRAHVVFGAEYSNTNGVENIYARKWGRMETGTLSPSAAQRTALGLPANVYANNVEYLATGVTGGIITSGPLAGTAFREDGTPYAFQIGTQIGAPAAGLALSNLQIGTSNYGNTALGTFWLAAPLERLATKARVTYDITDNVTAFADYSYAYNRGQGVVGTQQIPNGVMSSFLIQASNPYIPAATRAAMTAAGQTQFSIGYLPTYVASNSHGNTGYEQNNRTWVQQFNLGLKGTVGEDWNWDASWSHGWYHNTNNRPNTLNLANFAAATYVVTGANGQPACGPLATNPNLNATTRTLVLPGCVPYNPFVGGVPTEAQRYVVTPPATYVNTRLDSWAFNVSGSPIELWAGPLAVAFGAEYRKDTLGVRGEGLDARSFANGGSTSYGGARNVKEGYLEIGLPLIRDMAFAKEIALNGAARRTDYETSGAVTTAKLGLTWDVNDWLRFRATQSRDIRAPNLTELFQVGAPSTQQGTRNPFNGQVGALITRGSGNTDLVPEVAQTFTGGMVFRPQWSWASRFTLTADYYWIKLKGVIASVSGQETLNRCFAGIQTYCDAIVFDPNSGYGVALVNTRTYNLNQLRAKGVDLDISYVVPIEDLNIGTLRLHAQGGYQPTLTTIDTAGVALNAAGSSIGVSEWRWVFNFDYSIGDFAAQLQANYFNEIYSNRALIGPDDSRYEAIKTTSAVTVNKNLFPAMVYWNLSAQYDVNDNFQVFGTINNLLDKNPPDLTMIGMSGTGGQFNPYDLIGRAYRFGVRANF